MGGGGAMRAAAKVAGISVFTNTFRGGTTAENSVTVAALKAAKPASYGLLSGDKAAQKAAWEYDDWELAGSDEEFVVDRINVKKPRKVFGPVPTIQEAKEATSQLKDAIDQVYLSSPKSDRTEESVLDSHETKACITNESSVSSSAMQAFRLLKESPAAQNVVASIACDPNVWSAVMQNPKLVEFLESEKNSTLFESPEFSVNNSVDSSDSNRSDGLMDLLENVKGKVVDVVQYLTNLVESWFSTPKVEEREGFVDKKLSENYFAGGSFIALAMMVIMVVVMNR